MLEWWIELPWWLRVGVGLILIGISTALYLFAHRFWPWGWAVGAVFVLFGFPSRTERQGYW